MPAKTRIRSTKPLVATREQAERVLGEIATLTVERDHVTATLNAALVAAREEHEPRLAQIGKALEEKTELLRAWAESHPDEFPRDAKSLDMTHGRIGFRTGMPKLVKMARRTWADVLDRVRLMFPDCVRKKEEVDREMILNRAGRQEMTPEQLREIFCTVEQDEAFFIEPKLDQPAEVGNA